MRDDVCDKYEEYFKEKVTKKDDKEFMEELRRIYKLAMNDNVTLLCWCYPKRCHGETIIKFIKSFFK